uniref:2-methoxy-6-polyprenyl-1,4-benzoquinol methylase, mitochondrial n=1 Tax=Chromera velia CCMP2878 TaxID=1169474 RepID=A0A0G4HV18_9ALVE|mmetsp:Transcript_54073/g.105804  ORF Transcript_54073/g.105804 Transcript_54073/m.105804 type:complete len:260 (-) Transcript_54073:123-902(-)|eukprot:Cvel_32008.t1-p1 / transcript=Cvel_32008.t1 / gene=Cvel_32008 / organism=Chromera_velia_CCMP2878 / gene_product=Ubiquinone/menaquinone biosynthesis, putative / transcript_product=Ubiquinone/menaquinone biosynthesis, putative / location=Cvel_scaffold4879:380-3611(+) / protein_length=259 / sequence_SO=supercontig / SO=protein_coding / is_pseudo=false
MSSASESQQESVPFGYKNVNRGEKKGMVDNMFSRIADRYDLLNDLMSMGMHRLWKADLVRSVEVADRPESPPKVVDLAGGTGDVAFLLRSRVQREGKAVSLSVCDICDKMLSVGKARAEQQGIHDIQWLRTDGEELPFETESVDAITISFGLRNFTSPEKGLKESLRVLKPGGRYYCLEFSRVENPVLRLLYLATSFLWIPLLGLLVAGDFFSYLYLVMSIQRWPSQEQLRSQMLSVGFSKVGFRNFLFGVCALHVGVK